MGIVQRCLEVSKPSFRLEKRIVRKKNFTSLKLNLSYSIIHKEIDVRKNVVKKEHLNKLIVFIPMHFLFKTLLITKC